jgi:hypothetical protein
MRKPRIPQMLVDIVQTALSACNGAVFDSRDSCPFCGGKLSGYDTKKKQFAVLRDGDRLSAIHVSVKRFTCRQCGAICFADEPFYPDTRIGSPVVDLCLTLSATMSFSRAATYLDEMGVILDRTTVRNYARRTFPPFMTADVFGIRLPLSVVSLSTLAANLREGSCIEGAEALAACGFPSAERAPPDRLFFPEERDERDEQEKKEERQVQEPRRHGERT